MRWRPTIANSRSARRSVPSDSDISAARALIESAAHNLAAVGIESSRLDAEVLMAEAAGGTREAIITGSLDPLPALSKKIETIVVCAGKRRADRFSCCA